MSDDAQMPGSMHDSERASSIHEEDTSEIESMPDVNLMSQSGYAGDVGEMYGGESGAQQADFAEDTIPDDAVISGTLALESNDAVISGTLPLDAAPDAPSTTYRREIDPHEQVTMPIPLEPGTPDPKKTLAGSGGLDPNPDFTPGGAPKTRLNPDAQPTAEELGYTIPHIVPFEHTMVHVPGDENKKPAQSGSGTGRQSSSPAYQQIYRPAPAKPAPANAAPIPAQSTQPNTIPGGYTQPSPLPPMQSSNATVPLPPNAPQRRQTAPPGSVPMNNFPGRKRKRRVLGCTPGCLAIFAGVFVTFCGGLTLIVLILGATMGARLEETLSADVSQIADYNNFESTFFYDRNGALLYEAFTEGRRTNVQYQAFPQDLINATIAIEDDTFFTNPGFEVQATTRAFLQYVNLAEGGSGGSTITQQLVRNVLFDVEYRSERSIQRKVEEIMLAYLLTQRMSKQDILEMYLNEIYYGNLSYGAAAASRTLFDKEVQDLTLGEAALLAGLPQAPANLDPLNPDPAVQNAVFERWSLVLNRMVTERMITTEQRAAALSEGYTINPPDAPLLAPHFTVYAQNELETVLVNLGYSPEYVARGGLRVYTTVDLRLHDLAEQAALNQVTGLGGLRISNGAVIVIQPLTGEILAMVGSVDYNDEAIDGRVNVTTSPRQPGSTMKPLTYAAALERGITLGDIIWDTETVIGDYRPVNYDRTFHGPVRIRTALANSYNIPAVQTLRSIGVESLLELNARFGVETLGTDASLYGLSLTLGGGEVTLLELTRAYSVFANNGVYVPTTTINCILDNDDNILYQYEGGCPRGNNTANSINQSGFGSRVLDPRIAYLITDVLSDNIARSPAFGSNSTLNTGGIYTAVKTGTTDDYRDNWTIGYNRNVAVGVWVGNSSGEPMSSATTGVTGAAPIWNAVINGIYNTGLIDEFTVEGGRLPDQLDQPTGLSLRQFCAINALREPTTDCGGGVQEWVMDSPAGIPDGQGGLNYPPADQTFGDEPPPNGVWLREIEPDVYRVAVHPIPPDLANQIVINIPGAAVQPPAPLYCQVPVELLPSDPTAREQLFIAPPPNGEDAARAEQYARANGFSFLPTIACNTDLVNATGGGANIVTAFITQPQPNQIVYADMPILGTANFNSQQATYYKLELYGGQFGDQWVTMGNTQTNPVVNGQLEILPGLQPGNYILQLVVVGLDGNYIQPPYQVPFTAP